ARARPRAGRGGRAACRACGAGDACDGGGGGGAVGAVGDHISRHGPPASSSISGSAREPGSS
ncbi:hypothetical protein, partial [Burkholderia pseudomallei]|uniref:hypothetical protein n=1 Tax=Burkholderia pseudomallei TaxID=28450 RepID=UPI001C4B4CCF